MEKIYYSQMKSVKKNILKSFSYRFVISTCVLVLVLSGNAFSQVRAGAAFLKMFPGSRTQSMGNIHTGSLDDSYALLMNPGTGSYLRDWQWSAGYTKWIADIYRASFLCGRKFSFPWSKKTFLGLSFVYQGVPEFDSSDNEVPVAAANDLLLSFHIGQPLTFINRNISLGANIKYLSSKLDTYKAQSVIFDVGMLVKTRKINLGNSLLKYGYLALGGSVLNYGKGLEFEQEITPLPKMWRIGPSIYAGSHNGVQLQLMADYYHIQDEGESYGIGAELSFSNMFHVSGGYNMGNDLLNKVSFGLSVRLDDISISESSVLPGKNKGMRIDLASIGEGEFFSNVYEGSVSHFPVLPERFDLKYPVYNDTLFTSSTELKWDETFDPDLYDDIEYTVIVSKDSMRLEEIISGNIVNWSADENNSDIFDEIILFGKTFDRGSTYLNELMGGTYYWSVVAQDMDKHMRTASVVNGERISKFTVLSPDIEVKMIAFNYNRYITTTDYQGELSIDIVNRSLIDAKNIEYVVYDSLVDSKIMEVDSVTRKIIHSGTISSIEAEASKKIRFPWNTELHGRHNISIEIKLTDDQRELNLDNNILSENFSTVPRGTFACPDTIQSLKVSIVSIDLPIITTITFDTNRVDLRPEYYKKEIIGSPLSVIAERMRKNRNLKIQLKGYIDPNSGERVVDLGRQRAMTIKEFLIKEGVMNEQVVVLSPEMLSKRQLPADRLDAKWICEERRKVNIIAEDDTQKELFKPVRHIDTDVETLPLHFTSDIIAAVSYNVARMRYSKGSLVDSMSIMLNSQDFMPENMQLSPSKEYLAELLKNKMNYDLKIVDKEGRSFYVLEKETYLDSYSQHRKHRFAFPLQFDDTDPIYNFYWNHIADHINIISEDIDNEIVFEGHACKIGPERVNNVLSKRRARTFENSFLSYIREVNPTLNGVIRDHLESNKGYGETKPLSVDRLNGDRFVIGDNNLAFGRMLNRRIEIVFSLKE